MGLPSQRPSPRPRLTPGTPMDMLATPTLTEPTAITATLTPTTERGLLMLSPRPRPRLTPGILMVPMLATPTPTATPASTTVMLDTLMLTTMERGLLMPRPRPMPTTDTTAMPGPMLRDTDTEATEATTGDKFLAIQSKSSTTRTSLLVNLTFHPSVRLFGGVGI